MFTKKMSLLNIVSVTMLIAAILVSTVFSFSTARAASLVQITNFGTNPSGLGMYLYVPASVGANPAILVAVHFCTGSGPTFFSGTQFASLADQYGFIVIYPSATRNGNCFDVSSPQALTHNGGSDPVGIMSMVTYVEQHNNGDPNRVYVTGASSGAMMTNVLLGDYPDVFKAGAAFMGVPFACFAASAGDPTNPANQAGWNSTCSAGQSIKTPQQWGDLVRGAFPGYTGPRPRMQVWHGTADTTLSYPNFGEEIKQWTNVLGVSQTPSLTDTPQSGWTRTRYGGTGVNAPVEAISVQGAAHTLPLSGQAAMAIQFFGLNNPAGPTPTRTATQVTGPTATRTNTPTTGPSATPANTSIPSANFLTNANMESGTTGWVVNGAGTLSSDTSQFHGGTHSIKTTGRTAEWNGIGQNVAVSNFPTSGQNYTVSIWVRSQTGTPTAKATLRLTAGTTTYVSLASATINANGWTLLTGTVPVSWSGTLTGALFYVETAAGTDNIYIDDASLGTAGSGGPTNTPPPGPTATRTSTPTVGPSLTPMPTTGGGGGACSPVTSTITAPFTFDGAGTFCWQSSNLGTFINSWNTASVTINGVNVTNVWMGAGSYPAKINGFWYISYTSSVSFAHFEAK
jgi:acetylxylan esterase